MEIDEAMENMHAIQAYYNDKMQDSYIGFAKEDNESVDIAISIMRKFQKMFDKYEILTASFEDSDSPEVRSKKIDEFCIDTMRGLLGDYYAERIKRSFKGGDKRWK